jgi:hypothetical protein
MDKFLDKSNNTHNGLDNICNITNNNINYEKEKLYLDVLNNFKQKICHKILKFDPTKINNSYDSTINILWFQHILERKHPQEYIDIYKKLNITFDEQSNGR